ncbi:replication-relaxation family protein [Streptomyces sp. NBC_00237]|uniref:replication-relaxation family protein n=1 Tax=Streptomyces sp. NBC_00237 TaxID=2975687 RepID=UPI002257ED61|nr:replication-relaxation family protein [Streptomyces sp. NBC_00237]MCX5207640.1 replication-relaxation family protein [Streptomyces sp. NBC_00237]
MGGTFAAPARRSVRADLVYTAVGQDVPVLFVEVDNGTEGPPILADKIARYREFFTRRVTVSGRGTTGQQDTLLWRTVWPDPGRDGHPPLALVFTKTMGEEPMRARMRQIAELSTEHWAGTWRAAYQQGEERDGYRDYGQALPVLATTLARLTAHGPCGPIWWRYGHRGWQTLADALDNPDDYRAYRVRDDARRAAEKTRQERENARRQHEAQERAAKAARLETLRWLCPSCDERPYPAPGLVTGGPCGRCIETERVRAEEEAYWDEQKRAQRLFNWPGRK